MLLGSSEIRTLLCFTNPVLCQIFVNNPGPIRAGFKVGVWFSHWYRWPLPTGQVLLLKAGSCFAPSASLLKIENCARLAIHLN